MNLQKRMFDRRSRSLFALPMRQTHAAIWVYEKLLAAHQLSWILEIGTGDGSLSLYWALWAKVHNAEFTTYDIRQPRNAHVLNVLRFHLGAEVHICDVWDASPNTLVDFKLHRYEHPGLLFCDGGDKLREIQTFAPHAPDGSLIIGHDCEVEWKAAEALKTAEIELYQPWHDQSIAMGTTAGIFKRLPRR